MEVSQYRKQSNVIFAHFRSRGSGATRIAAPASERCAPRGHVRRQHRHDEQRWDDDRVSDVDASGIEQERVQDPLETEPITTPIAVPIPASTRPLLMTRRSTSNGAAPIAMRIPISRVRRLTLYATSPYKPATASTRPTAPIAPTISTPCLDPPRPFIDSRLAGIGRQCALSRASSRRAGNTRKQPRERNVAALLNGNDETATLGSMPRRSHGVEV